MKLGCLWVNALVGALSVIVKTDGSFPALIASAGQGEAVSVSSRRVSGAEVTCLLLMLALLLYSVILFFNTWRRNYRMPEGVFYFEEKTVEKSSVNRENQAWSCWL